MKKVWLTEANQTRSTQYKEEGFILLGVLHRLETNCHAELVPGTSGMPEDEELKCQ